MPEIGDLLFQRRGMDVAIDRRLVSARLSKRVVSRNVGFHSGFVRGVFRDAFLACGIEEGIKLESGFPFGCGQWIVLLLVFRLASELPEVVGFSRQLELRDRQPGTCVAVLEAANTWAPVELAYRTRHRFPARLLGADPQQLLGDRFLVGRARGSLLGRGEVQ